MVESDSGELNVSKVRVVSRELKLKDESGVVTGESKSSRFYWLC